MNLFNLSKLFAVSKLSKFSKLIQVFGVICMTLLVCSQYAEASEFSVVHRVASAKHQNQDAQVMAENASDSLNQNSEWNQNQVSKEQNQDDQNNKSQSIWNLDDRPWSAMLYIGSTAKQQLGTLIRGEYDSAGETLYSAEVAYTLSQENILRRILQPLVGALQIAGNIAYRNEHKDTPNITEYDGYLVFRWVNFPWNKYLTTTLAAGEGVSYANHVPDKETDGTTSDDSRRLLNYLMFEATFALPSHPEWQLLARIHHRSTAYGVFGNSNGGSNNVGIGIRYYFN